MAKRKIKEAAEVVEAKVEQIVTDVKQEATKDVATFTIDKWHVALAAVAITAAIVAVVL